MLKTTTAAVTTTGADGVAAGTATVGVPSSRLIAVILDYEADQPATMSLAITCGGRTILSAGSQATDRVVYPLAAAHDGGGTVVANEYVSPIVHGHLTLVAGSADASTAAVKATFVLEL